MDTNLTLDAKQFIDNSIRQINRTASNAYTSSGSLSLNAAHAALMSVMAQTKLLIAFVEATKEAK